MLFPPISKATNDLGITVVLNPAQREQYLAYQCALDGLGNTTENPLSAYCPISLTQTPDELKPILAKRQEQLIDMLREAGITGYDPGSAPYSPDTNITTQPNAIYAIDSSKIISARFFVGHNLLPSTGYGVESQKAIQFNRIPVILIDKQVRVSRMQPHRTIYLQYSNFAKQRTEFINVFKYLKQFSPGMGFNGRTPVLLGFDKNGEAHDLEASVYTQFPQLQYKYDGTIPILQLRTRNPELFYENL